MFKNKYGQFRSGWKIAAAIGAFLVIGLVVEMIVGFIILIFSPISGTTLTDMMDSMNTQLLKWEWVLNLLQTVIMFAVAVFSWKVIMKRKLSDMGLASLKAHKKELGMGLLVGAAAMTLIFFLLLLLGYIQVDSWIPIVSADTFIYLLLFISVGISEETFSRGFVMSVLRQTRSRALIIIVSSVLFSLLHIFNPGYSVIAFINIALVGALFGYMFMKSGNIWMPIGFHITWNYFQSCVFGMTTSGIGVKGLFATRSVELNLLSGGIFGPEDGLLSTCVLLLAFLVIKWYYQKETFDFLSIDAQNAKAVTNGEHVAP